MEATSVVSIPIDTTLTLSEQVRIIIRPDCGSCHTSTLPTAKPGALRVFDLAKDAWAVTMSREQLESFQRRLRKLSRPARSKVEAFVDAEMKERDRVN